MENSFMAHEANVAFLAASVAVVYQRGIWFANSHMHCVSTSLPSYKTRSLSDNGSACVFGFVLKKSRTTIIACSWIYAHPFFDWHWKDQIPFDIFSWMFILCIVVLKSSKCNINYTRTPRCRITKHCHWGSKRNSAWAARAGKQWMFQS